MAETKLNPGQAEAKPKPILELILGILFSAGFVLVAWNYALPDLFGMKSINYPQALAIVVISDLLLKHTPNLRR
jgi:hypothetical protein